MFKILFSLSHFDKFKQTKNWPFYPQGLTKIFSNLQSRAHVVFFDVSPYEFWYEAKTRAAVYLVGVPQKFRYLNSAPL